MNWLNPFDRPSEWSLEALELPFGNRPSIYAHVKAHIGTEISGLSSDGEKLPDESYAYPDGGIRFVAGGRDGTFGHHFSGSDKESVPELLSTLKAVLEEITSFAEFYERLQRASPLSLVDPLLTSIREEQGDIDGDRLQQLSRYLCQRAPDRGPVKIAIALLGLFQLSEEDRDLLLTLGRHEEFTLYVAVAIANTQENGEILLWELAQNVHGWGRIQIVERLAETEDPRIQRWMLRDGFKNSVMYEYLAYTCATAGSLLAEIQADEIDEELLEGAGFIIEALICGGPAEEMDDYEDGAAVTEHYLKHLKAAAPQLQQFLVLKSIQEFISDGAANWNERSARGWTEAVRGRIREALEDLLGREQWPELANVGLKSSDPVVFHRADAVARANGIDTWEFHFHRLVQEKDGNAWYRLMQTDDVERIDRILALAEEKIDLDRVTSGPGEELGLGPDFVHHSAVDWIVQDLGRFPGRGWTIVRAALFSPVVRNRNRAHKALHEWGMDQWPEDAREQIQAALKVEPKAEIRERMLRLLEGQALEE